MTLLFLKIVAVAKHPPSWMLTSLHFLLGTGFYHVHKSIMSCPRVVKNIKLTYCIVSVGFHGQFSSIIGILYPPDFQFWLRYVDISSTVTDSIFNQLDTVTHAIFGYGNLFFKNLRDSNTFAIFFVI